jgi:CoA:oxalate CoA-transferase|tara:strand:+ start:1251 stop:2450 length:1200 start_codon:yes stop_codon:yes gene_type:complete
MTTARKGAFDGIRVLEFAALVAGPSCGKYMADHGADVIKVERFPMGDVSRSGFLRGAARSPMFLQHNAGKRSICIDMKSPEGLESVRALIPGTDVVIEAFTPGVMARLGLGYGDLQALNPSIILCSISGFGQTGPNADRPGYAHISHAMAGWLGMQFLHRDPPEAPRGPGIAIGDTTTGLTAFGAVSAALYRKATTGEGDHIDIALFDSLFGSNDSSLQHYLTTGDIDVWYHPVHATKDGYLTANVGPDHRSWAGACAAMGKPELANDSRFADAAALDENKDAATEILRDWLATLSAEEAEMRLTEHHVACGEVKTIDKAVRQPQVEARGLVRKVDDPILGETEIINSAFCYANSESSVRGPAPTLGQHNHEILREILDYDDARLADMEDRNILRSEQI